MDGADARTQPLRDPRAVTVDSKGNLYILERNGGALRVVDTAGKIRTVVNASEATGSAGDGGPARAASMNGPKHVAVDLEDNVLVCDSENHTLRKYTPADGRIVRVAGAPGQAGTAGLGGPAEALRLNRPHGAFVAPDGAIYISDSSNNRVVKLVRE
jgi:DNA-binding beta-propeller fold protein YncE